jgi:hypothetical protein
MRVLRDLVSTGYGSDSAGCRGDSLESLVVTTGYGGRKVGRAGAEVQEGRDDRFGHRC